MSWSSTFEADVTRNGPSAWAFTLQRLALPYTDNPGSPYAVGSAAGTSLGWLVSAPNIAGAGVSVNGWMPQVGSCTVGVAIRSHADFQTFAQAMPRGTVVQILARSLYTNATGVIWLGTIESIDRIGAQCRVEMRSIFGGLRTRLSTSVGPLFSELDGLVSTRVNTAYTPGDTTLNLTTTVPSSFRLNASVGKGAVQVVPTSGDPFWLTYTGSSGTQLTGVSATAIMGTTAVGAVLNDAVMPGAYLEGHPYDIARQVLLSTGTGGNGVWDDFHSTWGYGIDDALVDHADIGLARDVITPYPSPSLPSGFDVVHAVSAAQPAAFDWLAQFLSKFGAFPVVRQGKISFRAAFDPKIATYGTLSTPQMVLTLADIISVSKAEVFGPTVAVRRYSRPVLYAGGSILQGFSSPATDTLPAEAGGLDAGTLDLREYIDNSSDASNVAGRSLRWEGFPPRVYVLQCRIRGAVLCPGDWVILNLPFIGNEVDPDFSVAGSTDRSCMVLSMSVDWTRQQVALTVAQTSSL